ncbi:MAG: hypothetical protein K6E94_04245, partial [Elusimicrobiaceae bacterium]|nr:hypothetical protein [Elusimicrobiaceae bacterium]
ERDAQIIRDKEKGKDKSYTDIIYIIPGPTKNLTITYLDFVKHYDQKRHRESLKRWYGIEVIIPEGTFHFLNTNPLIKKDKIIVPKNFN